MLSIQESFKFQLEGKPYSVVTYHPVTLENNTGAAQMKELIWAMDRFPNMNFLITLSNADAGGREVNRIWDREAKQRSN